MIALLFRMRMAMKIKPKEIKDGLLVYCAQSEEGTGDFSSLAIKNKRIEFRFDSGSGNGSFLDTPTRHTV